MQHSFTRLCAVAMLIIACNQFCFSQNNPTAHNHEQCGTQEWLETQFRAYPGLRAEYEVNERKMGDAARKRIAAAKGNSASSKMRDAMQTQAIINIPVVVHIVHTSPESITDAQIYALIDTLNKDFGGYNADSTKILPGFKPFFGKSNIQFCFAQRTPGGLVTNGIVRYTSSTISSGSGTTSDPIKSAAAGGADAWNPDLYFNIWIGTFTSSGLLGYAAFPLGSAENPSGTVSQQGVVIEKGSIPGGATTNYNNGRVLTHEAGHFFWLRHIWGDGTCASDFPNTESLDDTPPASGPSSGCSTGIVSTGCSGVFPNGRMYQNYMDYSNSLCMALFSVGQTIRMGIALDSFRASLKTSNGCEPLSCPAFSISVTSNGATSVSVNATGGVPPYTYSLDSVHYQTSNVFTGLTPGSSYTMYVKDSVFCKGRTTFIANAIVTLPLSVTNYCVSQAAAVGYTVSSTYNAGNIFTAQLSDAIGSFASPVNIGTLTATGSGTINATIPAGTTPGNRYRIRVVGSNPAVTGSDNGTDIEINNSSVTPAVTIAVSAGSNPGCNGERISFTATPVNGGTAPAFQWRRNGNNVATGRIYTTTTLTNNDIITCVLTSNSTCASSTTANSNAITVLLSGTLVPSVTIVANAADTICAGSSVTFTAIPVNGGSSPAFQWFKNGANTGVTDSIYTTASIANGDSVYCVLTSSITCAIPAFASSNKKKFVVNPVINPRVVISSNVGPSPCAGTEIIFTATPTDGGTAPSFQWKKNRVNVGSNSPTFTSSGLVTNDTITCVMTRSTPAVCLTSAIANSNIIKITLQNCSTQLLSGNAFLKDSYVEAAVGPCGSFASTVTAPAGFHPRGSGNSSSAGQLGFVADTSKNAWLNYVGDYFLPGTPEEGFGISINGTTYNNNLLCSTTDITGTITDVKANSLEKSAVWEGNIGGIAVKAKTYIPAGALYFVTKVTLTNTSAAPINNIYYMRNVDPDQGVNTPGSTGTSYTYNSIVYQTPNPCNRSLVSATTSLAGKDYMGLGSLDPRARVSKGGFSNRDAAAIWNGVNVSQSGLNTYGDSAISIAFKIGTLNINESTSFAFSYILGEQQLEQALAATGITVALNGVISDIGKPNDVCTGSATPIQLSNTGNYTNWSWSPATGLNTTSGTTVQATVSSPVTYIATGTGTCGTIQLSISLNPVAPTGIAGNAGSITGLTAPLQGAASVTYSIAPVANATKYIWKLPSGILINSGADSNVINVRIPSFAFCDTVSVTPVNPCSAGEKSSLPVCVTSPYAITPGSITGVCAFAPVAYLPYSGLTGSPTMYSIVWDAPALSAGFANITNASLVSSPIPINKPVGIPLGNYTGKITVGNGIYSSSNYDLTVPVITEPVVVPAINISASTGTSICFGTPVTFTATPVNGGATPIYQWKKNGLNVGTPSVNYTDNALLNGDVITCILTSTASCVNPPTATSNALTFTVTSTAPTTVSIAASPGNKVCSGTSITFTATGVNVGSSPTYQWKKNGVGITTGLTYVTSNLADNDTIVCELTSNNPCLASVTATSNSIGVSVYSTTTPTASGTAIINCGDSTILSATPTTIGNIINWYTAATGGSIVAKGESVKVAPNTTTTYYAEAGSGNAGSKIVTSIATSGAVVIDHNGITGDDRGGIVLSNNYVYYTGDSWTGRYNKNLSGSGTSLNLRDGFFSNLSNGELWQLGSNTSNGASYASGTATRLYRLSEDLIPTGAFITLSQSITLNSVFVAPGEGFVVLHANNGFYKIDLGTGNVTVLNSSVSFSNARGEGWASYGWSEYDGTNYSVCYVANFTTISKINTSTGATTILQTFSNLSDMNAIVFDGRENRMYFHHEGSSQFGGSSETLGYVSVTSTESVPLCGSSRVPVTITVNTPAITPFVTITPSLTGAVCNGTNVIFTASAANGGPLPVFQWRRNGVNVATGVIYSTTGLVNNDIISCVLTTSLQCAAVYKDTASITMQVITPSPYPSVSVTATASGNVCAGNPIVFTANPLNAGSSPVYQWKKNGINIGTNSNTYTDNALTSGTISCTITSSSPCAAIANSNSISITITAPVQPSVTITSNAGNSICNGTTVTFTATSTNGGSSPVYQWKKNRINIGTGTTISTAVLATNDTITCVLTSNYFCLTQTTDTSNEIVMTVSAIPDITGVSNIEACPGSTIQAIAFTGTGAQYRWTNNNTSIGLAASGSGTIPSFIAVNPDTGNSRTATITVIPSSAGNGYAYIANYNSNSVSVINLANNAVAATIPVNPSPWAIAASTTNNRLVVSNLGTPTTISVINTITNTVTSTIPVSGIVYNLGISPDGTLIYAANYSTGYVSMYNSITGSLISTFGPGSSMLGLTLSADGSNIYISAGSTLYTYSSSGSFRSSIPLSSTLAGIAVNADGSRIYVSNTNTNLVTVLNGVTNTVITSIPTGSTPYRMALSPDGKTLYAANNSSNNVTIINTVSNEVAATVPVGNAPSGIAASADGSSVYVSNQNSNTVSVINTATNTVTSTLTGFSAPVAWGNFISSNAGCEGSPATFTIKVTPANLNTWNGTVSTNWHVADNWACKREPALSDRVVIGVSANNFYPVIISGDNISVQSLKLQPGTSMIVQPTANIYLQ